MEPPLSSPVVNGNEDARAQAEAAPTGKRGGNWGLGELLRWCLPALLVGLALRAALTWSMPYGYVQYDSSDYLITVDRFIEDHHFFIHDKRSYLTPLLFSAAFLLPVPALITIAAAQHFMGLIATVIVGALVRLWFRFWKIAIIPVTVLFAASPWVIWYEHTIMGEAQYLFFTLITVLAGTLLARQPTMKRFLWFIVSMLLVSGTRLESKTFYLFAILLVVLLFWKQWKLTAMGFAAVVLTYVVAFHFSGNTPRSFDLPRRNPRRRRTSCRSSGLSRKRSGNRRPIIPRIWCGFPRISTCWSEDMWPSVSKAAASEGTKKRGSFATCASKRWRPSRIKL